MLRPDAKPVEGLPGATLALVPQKHLAQYAGVWGLEPRRFAALVRHVQGLNLDGHLRRVRAAIDAGQGPQSRDSYLTSSDGVAVIEVVGEITKYPSSLTEGPDALGLRRAVLRAGRDPQVRGLVLLIDSPGGLFAGTDDVARAVAKVNAIKPVVAYIEDLGASAAYWIASHAGTIIVNPSGFVGSIGVYTVLEDTSAQAETLGVRYVVVKSATAKATELPGVPVTEETISEVQRAVDQVHALFVAAVARGRGRPETWAESIADGRVHPGMDAQRLGLVDEVGDWDRALELARTPRGAPGPLDDARPPTPTNESPTASRAASPLSPAALVVGSPKATGTGAAIMPESEAKKQAAPPAGASMADLKEALPESSAEFRERCHLAGLTVEQATAMWNASHDDQQPPAPDEEQEQQAQAVQQQARAASRGVTQKLRAAPSTATHETEADPEAAFEAAVRQEMAAKACARHVAVAAVCRKQPELRAAALTAYNARHGRPVAAAS